ncbi:dTDP-4-dehydrorhamnose reductase [Nocardiopsis quinghaiensis]|uniref:dTDP-4-dehydrorhamnose reductase n=1 Tax=Nocardiopsis quinghaiensis TaxID=464995 RepID=UPI00123911EC|nr:dTDP-4-dehydrorhamnose reductase [Nocardiopsis quinghaiensis]
MRWLVTGACGKLGHDLVEELLRSGEEVVGLGRDHLDITDPGGVRAACARYAPDTVVNCAAYTDVDAAESRPDEAYRINAEGPRHLAEACARTGARLLHVSTDYVFSGSDRSSPYQEDHPTSPCSVYGESKLEGEHAVLRALPDRAAVLRTAWLYGAHGRSFVKTMLGIAASGSGADVVDGQVGQPTWTRDLARRIVLVGRRPDANGILHATNSGQATWFSLAAEVFLLAGADPDRVRPCADDLFPRAARRPAYSVLGQSRWAEFGAPPLRPWRAALREALDEMSPPES